MSGTAWEGYLLVGVVGALVTFVATFAMRRISPRIGAISMPGPRSVHTYPTPSLGGAAMFLGFLAAFGTASQLDQFHDMFDSSSEPLGVVLAAGIMFFVGALDDLREVSPPAKVAGQVLSGTVLSLLGVIMLYFRVPFGNADYIVLSPNLATLVTVLTVVFLANAMNLIDGLDGLAAGIVIVAGGALFLFADHLFQDGLIDSSNVGPLVAVIAVSICVGFLPHNFNPARIFMGDAGAMLLGLLLAVVTVTVGGRTADQSGGQTYLFFAPLLIPAVILAVPIVDTGFSVLRRVLRRQSLSTADREHLHHRLMRLGHGPRRAVVILWLWTGLAAAAVLIPIYTNRGNALVPLALGGLALLLFTYFHPGVRLQREATAAEGADVPAAGDAQVPAGDEAETGEDPTDPFNVSVVDLDERRRARGTG